MSSSFEIKPILESLGYLLKEDGEYWRSRCVFRNGNNETALRIRKSNGCWIDFVGNEKGNFEDLIRITLNLKNNQNVKDWLNQKNFDSKCIIQRKESFIKIPKVFSKDLLQSLLPLHGYWLNRGISIETLKKFKGGLIVNGKFVNRYTFPVFNLNNNIIGFVGRTIINHEIKWKICGKKMFFQYPFFLNYDTLMEKREVILVESIGDCLSLFDSGIFNIIVLFGTYLHTEIINLLLKVDPNKIIIALNNDKNQIGLLASNQCYKKLLKYFDKKQVQIALPCKKDFGEQTKEENLKWYSEINKI